MHWLFRFSPSHLAFSISLSAMYGKIPFPAHPFIHPYNYDRMTTGPTKHTKKGGTTQPHHPWSERTHRRTTHTHTYTQRTAQQTKPLGCCYLLSSPSSLILKMNEITLMCVCVLLSPPILSLITNPFNLRSNPHRTQNSTVAVVCNTHVLFLSQSACVGVGAYRPLLSYSHIRSPPFPSPLNPNPKPTRHNLAGVAIMPPTTTSI